MGSAYFYHLTRKPLVETLSMLLEKAQGAGWKVAVRGQSDAGLAALDQALWTYSEDSFVPHGLAGGPHDAAQPVVLTTETKVTNDAVCVMSVHGAEVDASELSELARVCILFDGTDPDAVQHARGQWKALKDAGASAQYWSEESGRWEKKAET